MIKRKYICIVATFTMFALATVACTNNSNSISSSQNETNPDEYISDEGTQKSVSDENTDDFDYYEKLADSDFPEASNMHMIKSWNGKDEIPAYSGSMNAVLNDNVPYLQAEETTTTQFFKFSSLDELGRSGAAVACVCQETLPHKQRDDVQFPEPSGWNYKGKSNNHKYDSYGLNIANSLVSCHLLGYSCIGEDTMEENFFTATPSAEIAMSAYERQIVLYVQSTGNHVMYRVTPIYYSNDLMAQGVQMEAYSVEDNGAGLSFNTFIYNVEPNLVYDYATGRNESIYAVTIN